MLGEAVRAGSPGVIGMDVQSDGHTSIVGEQVVVREQLPEVFVLAKIRIKVANSGS